MSTAPRHRVLRGPVLVTLAVLITGGVMLDQVSSSTDSEGGARRAPPEGPTIPSADAISTTWYCAEGTSNANGRADELVVIANLEPTPIDATVTVVSADIAPETRRLTVEPFGQARVEVSDLLVSPEPGVVVEVIGGVAVVEHVLRGIVDDEVIDVAVGPCARQPSTEWYFPAGTTTAGAQEWLALFNPFGDDAIVDLSFLTADGLKTPEGSEALVVPRRSRVSVPVHDMLPRQDLVATRVRARTGRVVAERSLRFDGTDGEAGLATSLGLAVPAHRWWLPVVRPDAEAAVVVRVANFSDADTEVEITVGASTDEEGLPSRLLSVPALAVASADISSNLARGGEAMVTVRTTRPVPVVVEVLAVVGPGAAIGEDVDEESDTTGTADDATAPVAPAAATDVAPGWMTTPGGRIASRRWALALGRVSSGTSEGGQGVDGDQGDGSDEDDQGDGVVVVMNPSGRSRSVELLAYIPGDPDSPASAPAFTIGPRGTKIFSLDELGVNGRQVLVVSADGPVVVGRFVLGPGVSLSSAIPARR